MQPTPGPYVCIEKLAVAAAPALAAELGDVSKIRSVSEDVAVDVETVAQA